MSLRSVSLLYVHNADAAYISAIIAPLFGTIIGSMILGTSPVVTLLATMLICCLIVIASVRIRASSKMLVFARAFILVFTGIIIVSLGYQGLISPIFLAAGIADLLFLGLIQYRIWARRHLRIDDGA